MASFFEEFTNTLKFKHPQHPKDVYSIVSPAKSKKYGRPSVMDKYRKKPMSDKEREFRQAGGIEMLAHKARGIHQSDKDWLGPPPTNDWADTGYQAAATVYKKTLDPSSQKNIDRDVGREVINQRSAQMHMGSPSNYKARRDRKMFGSTMLTMPKTVQRKK